MERSPRQQQTIARPVSVSGYGYWSGEDVRVEFRPAAVDSGVIFVRRDLPGCPRVAAQVTSRVEVPRRTSLVDGAARVDMVEHLLAALAGLHIDNVEVWIDRPELPGCDGSSWPFVTALQSVETVAQQRPRPRLVVPGVIRLQDRDAWIEARPPLVPATLITYYLDYPQHPAIGRQMLTVQLEPALFVDQLAKARTFLLESEAQQLRQQGLGGRVSYQDLLVFGPHGPLENTLRYPDECVRHKALDVVGDLALAPFQLLGHIVAYRSGHRLNAQLAARLMQFADPCEGLLRAG